MQAHEFTHGSRDKTAPRSMRPLRPAHALIAAVSLAVCGCADHDYVRSLTYDYIDPHRLGAERRATQDMQDSCYLSGYQYARPEGPPQIVSEDGAAGRHIQVTQAFTCVGTTGGV
jgi:hypothetical protein